MRSPESPGSAETTGMAEQVGAAQSLSSEAIVGAIFWIATTDTFYRGRQEYRPTDPQREQAHDELWQYAQDRLGMSAGELHDLYAAAEVAIVAWRDAQAI